jgi:ATP-dependent Clp protease ATP-binding subunit ClpC
MINSATMSTLSYDETLQSIVDKAGELAGHSGVPYCSAHLILALLSVENEASRLLVDRGLDPADIADHLARLDGSEPPHMLSEIKDRSCRLAQSCGAQRVGPLHLIMGLSSVKESLGFRIIRAAGIDPASLRSVALALATSGKRRPIHGELSAIPQEADSADESLEPKKTEGIPRRKGLIRQATDGGVPQTTSKQERRMRAKQDPRVTRGNQVPAAAPEERLNRFTLDAEVYPTLTALGRNLSEAAVRNQLEPLVGRRALVDKILDILGKRKANNPCLVGEPGVGKTAIIEGLAYLQVADPKAVPLLKDRVLVELNMGSLLSGTQLRGAFSERLTSLRNEVAEADGRVVLFMDELHTMVGAGAVGDGAYDAVVDLSAAMGQGDFPCVGATSTENYKKYIEDTPALQRRLQPVLVSEPNSEEAVEILRGIMPAYASHHQVTYLPEALDTAVRLSGRYIADRYLPDKAISLLDLAGSRARRREIDEVGREHVATLVAESANIPVSRLLMTDTERFLNMEDSIRERIVGHSEIIQRVCQVVRRNYAGFSTDRPIGSFLFLGPTGVGKTELVKSLANFLFQDPNAICRFDMSEFKEAHSVARLIGSPPGYVGHEEGGQLTESIRRSPYQIVLLDEVEKAHRDVLQILLQLLDDGRLTDGRGRTADFSNTVVVMTSNLGSAHYEKQRGPIGFGPAESNDADEWRTTVSNVLDTAKHAFPIELWNRIEERQVFEPLNRTQVLAIARLLVAASSKRLGEEKDIQFEATDAALQQLVESGGYDPQLGARPMRTTIQRLIEGPVAEEILVGRIKRGDRVAVDYSDGEFTITRSDS